MRVEVNKPSDRPFEAVQDLGVFLSESERGQRHIGILYRGDDQQVMVCHLAWHKDLRNQTPQEIVDEDPTNIVVWLQSSLDEVDRKIVRSAIAGTVALKKPNIPYSHTYHGLYFEEGTLEYKREAIGDGLTCATFIMAIFEALGFDLLKRDTWQSRQDDTQWQQQIEDWLHFWGLKYGVDVAAHLDAIKQRRTGVRFRPEEVAAGMADMDAPLDFQTAGAIGTSIVGAMRAA